VLDPWNIHAMYGPQPFDIRFVYNLSIVYQTPWFKSQRGILGRLLGGWSIDPLFTAQSGSPVEVNIGGNADCQSFGEMNCSSGSTYENAVLAYPYPYGDTAHYNVVGTNGVATTGNASAGGSGINLFPNPAAAFTDFRRLILGIDTNGGGAGVIRGFPSWDLDMSVSKEFRVTERLGVTFLAQFANIFNHFQPATPTGTNLDIDTPSKWGVVTGQSTTILPRQIEFGLTVRF
jgi:hypothetical protein